MDNYISDVLVITAHPDDAELSAGGTIAKFTNSGFSVSMVDLTAGEAGTRGTPEIRIAESMAAKEILKIKHRMNLKMPDSKLTISEENILKVITMIRLFKPKIVIMNPEFERHPDHEVAHRLVRKAMFKSGLRKIETSYEEQNLEPHRIRKMYSFMQSYEFKRKPDFFVDISDTFDAKMESIKAYKSQVYTENNSANDEPETRLSRPEFLQELEARAVYFGSLIGVKYAEPFLSVEPILIKNVSSLF